MEESNSTSLQMENRHEKAQKNTVAHTAVGGQAYDGHEKPRESTTSTSAVAPSASGFTPSISWNQGSKANIRITLGFKPSGAAYTNLLRSNEIDLTSSSPAPNHLLMPIAPEQPKTIPGTSTGVAPHGTHDQQGKIANMSSNPSFVEIADDSESDSNDDGSDSGASLDDVEESDEQESGEITSGEDVPTFENIGRGGQGKYGGDSGSVEPDKETDAMKFYSDSNPSLPSFGAVNLINSTVDNAMVIQTHSNADKPTLKPEPHILADLDPEILALQIRYFYTGKDPKTVNLNDDVKCFSCTKSGHLPDKCDASKCLHCGLVGKHASWACPTFRRCKKCAERGHDLSNCPYKLNRLNHTAIDCSLCQRVGHPENDCEMVWRTSGKPWESDINPSIANLSCYECGARGHLGNDCQRRRPGKQLGSSTWSLHHLIKGMSANKGTGNRQGIPRGGMTIRGRAQQQQPMETSSSEDERANFYRPPIIHSQPGAIRVSSITDSNRGERDHRNTAYPSRPHDRRRSRSPESRRYDGPRGGAFRAINEPAAYDQFSDSYRPPPSYPPRPTEVAPPRNPRSSDTYRPLPSAGTKAWNKYLT